MGQETAVITDPSCPSSQPHSDKLIMAAKKSPLSLILPKEQQGASGISAIFFF